MSDSRQPQNKSARRTGPKSWQLRYEQLEQRQLMSINNGSISGSLFLDMEANGHHDETDMPLARHVVYIDQNENGALDQHTLRGIGPVLQSIPDLATIQTPLHVPESDPISDVNLVLDITHERLSDLAMAIISPAGTRVELVQPGDLTGANLDDVRFDDESHHSISDVMAPYPEYVQLTSGRLSDFDGEEPGGVWYLEVTDSVEGQVGRVDWWNLEFTTGDFATQTNDIGQYEFNHLPAEPGVIQAQSLHEWSSVIVNISDEGTDFGVLQDGQIEGTVFHDFNVNTIRDNEAGLSGWTVYIDSNGNGHRDVQQATALSGKTQPIIDFHTTVSQISMDGLEGRVLDVNVGLNILHTWNDDLDVFLIGPAGTRVELFTDIGRSQDNFLGTVLDDEAEEFITDNFLAPYSMPFRPEGYLTDFDGEDPNGIWRLVIMDDGRQDEGVLQGWSLDIVYGELATITDEQGNYQLRNLQVGGPYELELQSQSGWAPTIPAHGGYSIQLQNGEIVEQSNFGAVRLRDIGDFNGDESLGCPDIDQLVEEIAADRNNALFDMTQDGAVDQDDIGRWLDLATRFNLPPGMAYRAGDANLDGNVDASDLNVVGLNWLQNVSGWCGGDFNADGVVNPSDLNNLGLNWLHGESASEVTADDARAPRAPLSEHVVAAATPADRDSMVNPIPSDRAKRSNVDFEMSKAESADTFQRGRVRRYAARIKTTIPTSGRDRDVPTAIVIGECHRPHQCSEAGVRSGWT